MRAKQIINIVFYNYYEENTEKRNACIFYRDGSVVETTYDDGITACEEIVKERNITSTNVFKEMINRELVHVMTGEEFKAKFQNYINHELIDREMIDEVIDESMPKVMVKENKLRKPTNDDLKSRLAAAKEEEIQPTEDDFEDEFVDEEDIEEEIEEDNEKIGVAAEEVETEDEDEDEEDIEFIVGGSDTNEEASIEENEVNDTAREEDEFENDFDDDYDDNYDEEIEDQELKEEKKENKITKFFKRQASKFKKAGLGIRSMVVSLAVLAGLGGAGYALAKNSKNGKMFASNISKSIETVADDIDTNNVNDVVAAESIKVNASRPTQLAGVPTANILKSTDTDLYTGNNDDYNDYTYEQLLEVTKNETQKTAMTNLGTTIFEFNGDFADAYVEEGKDVRAALKVEEVEALQVAYNDYSKDELKAIFNGTEVRADKMAMDYHAASMQLKGAYLIETSENPVDMSYLLETQEGKDFYNKYHTMYLEAKEATGQDRIDKVNAFYAQVRQDFPITQEIRTEGIAHADAYAMLESYKLAVTPMIASAEMLFQNLELDYTLNDMEVDFINDIGLCNYADDTFERLETITLSADEDKTNPTELQYRNSLIKVLEAENHYVIDDEHRELTKLDRYQRLLEEFNLMNDFSLSGIGGGSTSYTETTTTSTETLTWEDEITEIKTEIDVHEEEISEEEKQKIDDEINQENEKAKEEAEEEAEKERQRIQKEEDEKAKKVKEEAEKENQQVEKDIEKANDTINKNNSDTDTSNDKKINEKDFDNKVHFDEDKKDENGNLDPSVKDITTDGTDDQTGKELPDPNETGEEFDKKAPEYKEETTTATTVTEFTDVTEETAEDEEDEVEDTNSQENNNTDSTQYRQTDTTADTTATTDYPEGTKFYDADGNEYDSYDELLDAYLKSLETETATETDAYQYSK